MAALTADKATAIEKAKFNKRIFIGLIILIAAALITFGVIKLIKFIRQKNILSGEQNNSIQKTISPGSSGSSKSSSSTPAKTDFPLDIGSSGDHVLGLQRALNKLYNAGLAEDGQLGPLTQSAVVKNLGSGNFPVSENAYIALLKRAVPSGS